MWFSRLFYAGPKGRQRPALHCNISVKKSTHYQEIHVSRTLHFRIQYGTLKRKPHTRLEISVKKQSFMKSDINRLWTLWKKYKTRILCQKMTVVQEAEDLEFSPCVNTVSQPAYLGNEDIASFLVRVVWQQQCSCFISHPQLTPSCCSTFSSVPISHICQ